jgi:hypothetical protein
MAGVAQKPDQALNADMRAILFKREHGDGLRAATVQETHMTPFDTSRSGHPLLAAGIILYLIVLGASATLLGFDTNAGAQVIGILVVPVALASVALLLAQTVLFVGIATGVPWVSLGYGLSLFKRDWMTIVGCILLLATLCAILGAVTA